MTKAITNLDSSSTDAIIITAILAPANNLLNPYTEKKAADADSSTVQITSIIITLFLLIFLCKVWASYSPLLFTAIRFLLNKES